MKIEVIEIPNPYDMTGKSKYYKLVVDGEGGTLELVNADALSALNNHNVEVKNINIKLNGNEKKGR